MQNDEIIGNPMGRRATDSLVVPCQRTRKSEDWPGQSCGSQYDALSRRNIWGMSTVLEAGFRALTRVTGT